MSFLTIAVLCCVSGALAGYADSSQNTENDIGGGAAGAGGGAYGYSGSFSGTGGPPGGFQQFPFPAFDFGALTSYLQNLQKYHEDFIKSNGGGGNKVISYSYASSSPNARTSAKSSFTSGNFGLQQQGAASAGQGGAGGGGSYGAGGGGGSYGASGGAGSYGAGGFGVGTRGGFGGGFSSGDGTSFTFSGPIGDGAAASAAIGPDGVHQTASVFPQNPNAPNINTRFAGGGGGDGGGFKSVFTSSQSGTTNVNGQPQTFRQATTTVNDNGKVTTYTAKNP